MSAPISLTEFALRKGTPTLSLTLGPGQVMAVFGPAASGKSWLLKCLAAEEKPPTGKVRLGGVASLAGKKGFTQKSTPLTLAKASAGNNGSERIAEVLSALNLWDARNQIVSSLSPAQQIGCELLAPLASRAELLLIDCQLDSLDPWTRRSCVELLRKRCARGTALVIATNRASMASLPDVVIVLSGLRFAFSGSYGDLLERGSRARLDVRCKSGENVGALVDGFAVEIQPTEQGIALSTARGQELAAKLLLEGYGEVQAITLSEPTPDELIRSVLR